MTRRARWLLLICLAFRATPAPAFGPRPDDPPLFRAVARADAAALARYAGRKADLDARDGSGRSGLIAAAAYRYEDGVRFFLMHGADVDARDMYGYTALHYAAVNGDARIATLLALAGANPVVYSKRCMTPADMAAGYSHASVYDSLSRRLKSAPKPTDGTAEECALTGKVLGFQQARIAFHTRLLAIASVEDYGYALESLRILGEQPLVGQLLLGAVLDVVDQPSPEGAQEFRSYDAMVRQAAVTTLGFIARSAEQKAAVAARLTRVVATGGCAAFKATSCEQPAASCQAAPARDLWGAVRALAAAAALAAKGGAVARPHPAWPRTPAAEACFNCQWCEATKIGNAFTAALTWFRENPAYAGGADQALALLANQRALPKDTYQSLRQKYLKR